MSVTKAAVKMVEIHLPQVMIAILCTFHPSHKLWGIEWVHWAYPMHPFGGACWRANYFFQLFFSNFFSRFFFVYLFGLGTFDTKFVSRDDLMISDNLHLVGKIFKKSGFSLARQALSGKFGLSGPAQSGNSYTQSSQALLARLPGGLPEGWLDRLLERKNTQIYS